MMVVQGDVLLTAELGLAASRSIVAALTRMAMAATTAKDLSLPFRPEIRSAPATKEMAKKGRPGVGLIVASPAAAVARPVAAPGHEGIAARPLSTGATAEPGLAASLTTVSPVGGTGRPGRAD